MSLIKGARETTTLPLQSPRTRWAIRIRPRLTVFICWVGWTFVGAGLAEKYLHVPLAVLWLGLYAPIGLLAILSTRAYVRRPAGGGPLLLVAIVFAVYLCGTAFAHTTSPFGLALRLRDYLKYVVVFFPLAWLCRRLKTAERLLKIGLGVMLIQTPLVVFQYVWESGMVPDDRNGGTFGQFGTGQLMILVACTVCCATALAWQNPDRRVRWLAVIGWMTPVFILGGAFAGILFVGIGLLAGAIRVGVKHWSHRALVWTAVLCVAAIWAGSAQHWIYRNTGQFGEHLEWGVAAATSEVADSFGNPGRLFELKQIWREATAGGWWLTGRGAGVAAESLDVRIADRGPASKGKLALITSVNLTLFELGVAGLILYLLLIGALVVEVRRFRKYYRGGLLNALYASFWGVLAIHIAAGFYLAGWNNTWSSFAPWWLGAILVGCGGHAARHNAGSVQQATEVPCV